jgi:hypothetical protein
MTKPIDVDVWVRGENEARTVQTTGVPRDPSAWTDQDVRTLLTEMLLALDRAGNPGAPPSPVALRGFSWIVSPAPEGVLVHIEVKMGTVSAGPFAMDEARLTAMVSRVMLAGATPPHVTIH